MYIVFTTMILFCTQIQSSQNFLEISNVPLTVGTMYAVYKMYEGYQNENEKISLIQKAVNDTTDVLIQNYDDINNENSLKIKEFLTNNKEAIEGLKNTSDSLPDKFVTGSISQKSVINKLKINQHKCLKTNLEDLKISNDTNVKSFIEVITFGLPAFFEQTQKLLFDESVSNFVGKKIYTFLHSDSKEKTKNIGDLFQFSVLFAVAAPTLMVSIVATCWPILLAIEFAIKNINVGVRINKKYYNGILGLTLEKYFVKK